MAKVTAWAFTLVGVLYLLPLLGITALAGNVTSWLVALAFLAVGVTKLSRNYGWMAGAKKRR